MNSTSNQVQGTAISTSLPLVFVHQPKTGGMSVFAALTEHYGPAIADLYNVSPRNAGLALQSFRDQKKAVYCGHYSFGVHEWFDRPVSYAAVVREPVARLVSLYHYCQPMLKRNAERFEEAGRKDEVLWADMSLSDFYLDFPEALRGDFSPEAFFRSPSAELDNGMVRRFSGWGLDPKPCPEAALEKAKLNIERHFSVVGVLERYADTLDLIARTYGFAQLAEKKVNQGKTKAGSESLPEQVLERIRDMNKLDTALYRWVVERFDAALARPAAVVPVPGGGRKDMGAMPLWRSVGQSPLREAARSNFGKRQRMNVVAIGGAAFHPEFMQLTITTRRRTDENPNGALEIHELVLPPLVARRLLHNLNITVDAYEKKHGPIEHKA